MNNYNVNLLKAIYEEYGLDTFITRLKSIYKIEIPRTEIIIIFLGNQIEINYLQGNIKSSTITFYEEYYEHIKYFEKYNTTSRYDNNHNPFEKIFSFYTPDNSILALDEIDASNIKSRRIIKTTEEDKDLLFGEYEKAQRSYSYPDAREDYYFRNNSGNVNIKKIIGMNNGIYYFSYNSKKNIPAAINSYSILEVGSTTNKPILNSVGRTRNNNEIIIESVKKRMPNILIRGALIGSDTPKTFFKISILKSEEGITIHYISSDTPSFENKNKVIVVPTENKGEFTSTEIDNIIIAIKNNLTIDFGIDFNYRMNIEEIIEELLSIKEEIERNKHCKTKNPDAIDFKLNQFNDIEHLAFDIYENLPKYLELIEKKQEETLKSPSNSLKKTPEN